MTPFIVYALPRSRTYWLSLFLTYGPWHCYHDLALDVNSVAHFSHCLDGGGAGAVETGSVLGWRAIHERLPDIRIAVVRRPISEVFRSLLAKGIEPVPGDLEHKDALLDDVSSVPNVLSLSFEDLNGEAGCSSLFEHCLQIPFDRLWWESLRNRNLQIDMPERLRKMERRRPYIERMKAEIGA